MKKKGVSLAFKLNLLLMLIVLAVSLVLVKGSYDAYTRTVYEPCHAKLDKYEKLLAKDEERDLDKLAYCVQGLRLPEFDEMRATLFTEEEDGYVDENPFYNWLQSFCCVDGSLIPDEEYQSAHPDDEYSVDTLLSSYYAGCYFLYDIAMQTELSNVVVVTEPEPGRAVGVAEINTSYDNYSIAAIANYGEVLGEYEPVEIYQRQKKHENFTCTIEDRAVLAKVIPVERSGEKFYLTVVCDVTAMQRGQRAYLLQCLLFVAFMVAAAISLSLFLLRRMATKPLRQLAKAATAFAAGESGYRREDVVHLNIRSNDEIGELYREIRSMQTRIIDNTERLTAMTAEKERISMELDLATKIQAHMLPSSFPAFPDRKEFDVYASMKPAKEVGGDFYDFFLLDEDHLGLVMADVSGKGVPAALFMMVSKILVKNYAMTGLAPAEVLEAVNRQICSNNPEQMFVTVWMGVLELSTGRLTAANAGHEYPLLKQPESGFTVYKDKHGFVIGGMDGMKYRSYELVLRPGARLFVYTDGVPEATNAENELFGLERTLLALNRDGGDPRTDLERVQDAVDAFVGQAEQFDDMTMLCLEYRGPVV